jgi:hypothetical protein
MRYPRDVEGQRKMVRPRHNRAGALDGVEVDGATFVQEIASTPGASGR